MPHKCIKSITVVSPQLSTNEINFCNYDKHNFFETQFRKLELFIDKIAERIRSIGHYPPATLNLFLKLTHLAENNYESNNSQGFIKELLTDHETIIIKLKETSTHVDLDLHHPATGDFITRLSENHESMVNVLRANLYIQEAV